MTYVGTFPSWWVAQVGRPPVLGEARVHELAAAAHASGHDVFEVLAEEPGPDVAAFLRAFGPRTTRG